MKKFGLIGLPLTHSFSKKFFTEKFENEDIDAQYELFELSDITALNDLILDENLNGLNVTIPYKEKVLDFLDELDETAAAIGAVNVVKFIRTENSLKLKGFNSDTIGFEKSILHYLKPQHKKALILGTGGASKAIYFTLQKLGIEPTFVSRTVKDNQLTYWQLNEEIMVDYLVIINASPVGTFPHSDECPDIPYEFLTENHLLFDVVYNPAETVFLKKGKEQGAQTLNGEQMLIEQAIASWEIWNS
jgi:shikimate dehydrogenase